MTQNEIALWVQVAAVLAAIGAAIVALGVSATDRRNARTIAQDDRRAAARQSLLMFELEVLLRLSQNLRRGGSTDSATSQDMGAEAGAIIGAIGPGRLPRNYAAGIPETDEELRAFVADESKEEWLRRSVEAQLAVRSVANELNQLIAEAAD